MRIFAALHFFETQALRASNDTLQSSAAKQSSLLRSKENSALLLDKLSQMKGDRPTEHELKEAGNTAFESVVKTAWGMISKGPFPPAVRQSSEQIDDRFLLHEANDGEARVAGLISDYKSLLQEMRK